MKNLKYILTIVFASCIFIGYSQYDTKDWIIRKTQMYSPNSATLLSLYDRIPNRLSVDLGGSTVSTSKNGDTYEYLKLENYETALNSMSTNIHEIGHGYGGVMYFQEANKAIDGARINFRNINQGFYQGSQEYFWIEIEKSYIFPSRKLYGTIPIDLRTFRFNTYINGNNSTQQHGVIGLLDEMNSYFLGSKFDYDMFPVYKELYGSKYLNKWVMEASSSMTAYFEFDFFVKEYLLYSKNYQPQTYEYLKNNLAFKSTYQKIHNKFKQVVDLYEAKVNREKVVTNFDYDSPFYSEDYLRLKSRLNSGIYRGIEYDFLD
jgi:hypothetical protein